MASLHSELLSEGEWDALAENLRLSPRQADIVCRLLSAKSDNEIARELNISVPTVRTYMTRMFQKFEVKDRVGLLVHVFTSLRNIGKIETSAAKTDVCRAPGLHVERSTLKEQRDQGRGF